MISTFAQAQLFADSWISFNLLCSILTLWLIFSMNLALNGYLMIILTLTVHQMCYDGSFVAFFNCNQDNKLCGKVQNFLTFFFGTQNGLWTVILSFVCLYVIIFKKSINVRGIYPYLFVLTFLIAFSFSFPACYFYWTDMPAYRTTYEYYSNFRMSCIGLILLAYFVCVIEVRRLVPMEKRNRDPLFLLSQRLSYYPIIQVLTRIGSTWFQMVWDGNIITYVYAPPEQKTTYMNFVWYFTMVTLPMGGFGYFLVFLVVQKGAYKHFKSSIHSFLSLIFPSVCLEYCSSIFSLCCCCGGGGYFINNQQELILKRNEEGKGGLNGNIRKEHTSHIPPHSPTHSPSNSDASYLSTTSSSSNEETINNNNNHSDISENTHPKKKKENKMMMMTNKRPLEMQDNIKRINDEVDGNQMNTDEENPESEFYHPTNFGVQSFPEEFPLPYFTSLNSISSYSESISNPVHHLPHHYQIPYPSSSSFFLSSFSSSKTIQQKQQQQQQIMNVEMKSIPSSSSFRQFSSSTSIMNSFMKREVEDMDEEELVWEIERLNQLS